METQQEKIPVAATPEEIRQIKTQLGHIFDVDTAGNLTLKTQFNIPEFKMIFVRGGDATLGDESFRSNPPHDVKLTYNYFMGQFPVTQEIYKAITGKNPSRFQGINHPVEKVNWKDAMDCCNLLNKQIGLNPMCGEDYELLDGKGKRTKDILKVSGFRLPTETEWEYAAKGGSYSSPRGASTGSAASLKEQSPATRYAGSNFPDEIGWYDNNNGYETKPVGLKFPNQLGIYDMSGNVWEWCIDRFDGDYYKKDSNNTNPANLGKGSARVLRGGSWRIGADGCRMAGRGNFDPDGGWYYRGFRLLFAFQFT